MQLIKLKHYDSSRSLCVSFPPKQSHAVLRGLQLRCGRAWLRQALKALGHSHKKTEPDPVGEGHSCTKCGCHLKHVMSSSGRAHWYTSTPLNRNKLKCLVGVRLYFAQNHVLIFFFILDVILVDDEFMIDYMKTIKRFTPKTGSHGQGKDERFHRQVHICILTQVDENWNLWVQRDTENYWIGSVW